MEELIPMERTMSRLLMATLVWLAMTSYADARKCCVCCDPVCCIRCEPTPTAAPLASLPPTESAAGCDDVRQAPTCRRLRTKRLEFRMASGVAPEAPAASEKL